MLLGQITSSRFLSTKFFSEREKILPLKSCTSLCGRRVYFGCKWIFPSLFFSWSNTHELHGKVCSLYSLEGKEMGGYNFFSFFWLPLVIMTDGVGETQVEMCCVSLQHP